MTSINKRLGLKAGGARARLNSLSGVACPECGHRSVISNVVHGALGWCCGFCGHIWRPAPAEIAQYNARVRERDRIEVTK